MSISENRVVLVVDDLRIDVAARQVTRGGDTIDLPRLSFDLLVTLTEAAPDALSIEALMAAVWPGLVVSSATVAKRVELLRQALGDSATEARYIELVRGFGYRMACAVSREQRVTNGAQAAAVAHGNGSSAPVPDRQRPRRVVAMVLVLLVLVVSLVIVLREPPEAPGSTEAPPERTIAVLPFEALGYDPAEQWFAEGLAEELTHMLARTGALKVAGRSSAFAAAQSGQDAVAMGRSLGVAYVLGGTVRRENGRLRIVVRLLDTREGFQQWSETFDMAEGETLALQLEITERIAERFRFDASNTTVPDRMRTSSDPEAYALYLQAVSLSPYPNGIDLARAQALIEQVVERDPGFAPGWNRLAAIHGRRLFFDRSYPLGPAESIATVRSAVDRALAIDPTIGEAYANLAGLAWVFDLDMERAAGLLEQAVRLDPWNLEVLSFARDFARAVGNVELSAHLGAHILARDPLCASCRTHYASTLDCQGAQEASERQWRIANEQSGDDRFSFAVGRLRYEAGDFASAASHFQRDPNPVHRLAGDALLADTRGDKAALEAALEALMGASATGHWQIQFETAAMLGRYGLALERLQLGAASSPVITQGMICEARQGGLRDRPEYRALVVHLGRNEEGGQAIPFDVSPLPTPDGRTAQ